MSADRLEQLISKHRVVGADLAAIVARADQRRAASADLRGETEELIAELTRVVSRSEELQRAWNGKPPAAR